MDAAIVRLATDGIWLADLLGSQDMDDSARHRLVERLIELTPL